MTTVLALKNINVKGGHEYRLRNINLSVRIGEKIALLGHSGAGKSTLLSVANGSLKPHSGEVSWKGLPLKTLKPRQRNRIATLWQDLRLVEELTVAQNVNIGALSRHNLFWAFSNLLITITTSKCLRCLDAAGLRHEFLTTPVNELSGGQRQRVAIARLLRQQAELILADEPLSHLDPTLVNDVMQLLLKKKSINSINIPETCLISLHRPDLVTHFTRVIGLKGGQIVLNCPVNELLQSDLDYLYKER